MTNLPGQLYDMLPGNLKAAETASLGYALDRQMERLLRMTSQALVLADIPRLCESFCDTLAATFSVDGYDQSLALDTKRSLLQNILEVHSLKGTAFAVQKVVGAIHGEARLSEWFRHGGDPYTFRIHVDAREGKNGVVAREDLIEVVDATKSLRSHLEGITVWTDSAAVVALTALSAETLKTTTRPQFHRAESVQSTLALATRNRSSIHTSTRPTLYRREKSAAYMHIAVGSCSFRKTTSSGVKNYG